MDLEYSEEQKMLKQNARAFLDKEIVPVADAHDRKGITVQELKYLVKKMLPLGFGIGPLPEEYGGANLDFLSYAVLLEEAARAWYMLASTVGNIHTNCERLLFLGNREQQRRFIPPLVAVDKIMCTANSEPNAGSNVAAIETTAVRSGNYYVINGTKTWSSRAMYADYVLLLAVTDRSKGSHGGHSHFVVEKEVSPFRVRPINLMGIRGGGMAEISFEDCKVPLENLLGGEEGGGYKKQLMLWQRNRAKVGLEAVGVAQAAVDASIRYAKQRQQFGRPIGKFQLVQGILADMIMKTEAARWLCYRAISLAETGHRSIAESCMAKVFAVETATEVTSSAIEIHGAFGLTEECPVQRYYRDARCITMPDATSEISRLMIGREFLGINAIY